jgi:O-antigen ligase
MLWALILACTARALVQVTGLAATSRAVWTGGERVSAFGQNPNLSAIIMASGLAAVVGLLVLRRPQLRRPVLLAVPAAPLLAWAIIQTGSRGGLASAAVGLVVLLFSGKTFAGRLRHGLLGVVAVGGLAYAAMHSPTMHNRMVANSEVAYLAGRERIYPAALEMIREKPLTGWGPVENQYEIAARIREKHKLKRDAHNLVLELLTSTGIIGAVPFLMGLVLCVDGAVRARHGALGLLPLGIALTVLTGTISGTWIASKVVWLALGLALAAGLYWRPTVLEERWSRCAV